MQRFRSKFKQQVQQSQLLRADLTPMLDVMFNLLIFFLVSTTFTLPEGLLEAKLPRTEGISESQNVSVPIVPIKIFIEKSTYRVSSSLVYDVSKMIVAENIEGLESVLKGLLKRQGITVDTPIIIAAHNDIQWDRIVEVYNLAVRLKFTTITFAEY